MRVFAAALVAFTLVLAGLALPARAVEPDEMLSDPAREARAEALGRQLRCLVCQNQSIEDSAAALARDLRVIVRERISQGESDAEIKDFLVARYGDFVLLEPPMRLGTYLLWFGPLLALLIGVAGFVIVIRRRRKRPPPEATPLTAEERRRLGAFDESRAQ